MNLINWLSYIESLHVVAIDLGLSRIFPLAKKLKLTEFDVPVITVAGTNGKGSVMKCLESIYLAAGYQTAAYTSPHLMRFNERLRINENEMDDQSLIQAFEIIEEERKAFQVTLSFFEFTTLACLLIIKQKKLDVIILEVGLGGRLDAVNVVKNDCAVITNVDLDHTDWLGDTREKIAYEKAGIMKANKMAICGEPNPPEIIREIAAKKNSTIKFIGQDYQIPSFAARCLFHPNNIATAVEVVKQMRGFLPVNETQIEEGVTCARLSGRHDVQNNIWFDVAHNPQSVAYLHDRLKSQPVSGKQTAIFSMLKDKDWRRVIDIMRPIIDKWYVVECHGWRALPLTDMIAALRAGGVEVIQACRSMQDATSQALQELTVEDRCVVFGSFQTVAGVKTYVDDKTT